MSVDTTVPGRRGRGRPAQCPRELAVRLIQLRIRGLSYAQIGDVLNAERVPTPTGRPVWLRSHVDRLLHTRYASELAEEMKALCQGDMEGCRSAGMSNVLNRAPKCDQMGTHSANTKTGDTPMAVLFASSQLSILLRKDQ